ncbi:MAG: lipocalin family protein [Lewinellaceae bacterium]|nr:lipocalin family protein [Lewinellaceae bacterium]
MKKSIVVVLVFILGCAGKYNEDQLVGSWKGVEWKDVTNEKIIDTPVAFSFKEDGRYEATAGTSSEKGKYWISGENLHTQEDGKAEKKVKITKLQNDTLVFQMNRAGVIEEIMVVRGE